MTVDRPDRAAIGRDALAVLVYVALLVSTGSTSASPRSTVTAPGAEPGSPVRDVPMWLQLSLIAAAVLPVAARRLAPLPVFCWVLAVTTAAVMCAATWDPFLPAAFALYTVTVTREGQRWWERWLPGLAVLPLGLAGLLAPAGHRTPYCWSTPSPAWPRRERRRTAPRRFGWPPGPAPMWC